MSYNQGQRSRRPLYAPPPPSGRQHGTFGYWVPLITISTIALGGLAAWIWSERSEYEDDYHNDKPPRPSAGVGGPYPNQGSQSYNGPPGVPYGGPPPSQSAGPQGVPPSVGGAASSYYTGESQSREAQHGQGDGSFFGQVKGAIGRTPSPQQFFDTASRQVGAAYSAAGSALGRIMEEDKNDYYRSDRRERRGEEREGFSDHERWSEEAEEKLRAGPVDAESEKRAAAGRAGGNGKEMSKSKRVVAVVVSAESSHDAYDEDAAYHTEHAHDSSTTDLFVLIYAPDLKSLPPLDYQPSVSAHSNLGSSYSAISTPAMTPGEELHSISPRIDAQQNPKNKTFDALYQQAQSLVSNSSQILPFTTSAGYVQLLKALSPRLVYISDTLSGAEGETVAQLKGWVGHTILVAGDEGHGGLADTETEDEGVREKKRWYERSAMVGLGKEVEVVDAGRVGDDWGRRVGGRE